MRVIYDFNTPTGCQHFTLVVRPGVWFHYMRTSKGQILIDLDGNGWRPTDTREVLEIARSLKEAL